MKGEPGISRIKVQSATMPRRVKPAKPKPRFSAGVSGTFSSAFGPSISMGDRFFRRGSITASVRNHMIGVKTTTMPMEKNQFPAIVTL